LRRQAALLREDPLPLVVLTPKSLLRHPAVASTPAELEEGRFRPVLDDAVAQQRASGVRRVVLCSGKVAVDLETSERHQSTAAVAVCRVEQLYPFPAAALRDVLETYSSAREVVWVQEEPENMGARQLVRPLLEEMLDGRCPLRYIGRPRSSSPSEGSAAWHQLNQKVIVEQAFLPDQPERTAARSKPARGLAGATG